MADHIDIDNLSDEEMMNLTPEQIAAMSDVTTNTDENQVEETSVDTSTEEDTSTDAEDAPAVVTTDAEDTDENADQTTPAKQSTRTEAPKSEPGKATAQPEAKTEPKVEAAAADVDYKAAYGQLFAPFKANGRDIQINSVEEARQLMQMGANYNKKMSGIKPHLATVRMLEDAGIKTEDLNFLIDVHKKNPDAINKLVKDSGIDPMDLSADKAAKYVPGNHQPSEVAVELDQVLEEIKDSPAYDRTLTVVTKEWDTQSRKLIGEHPQLLNLINQNIESGVFDVVSTEVERQKVLGGFKGLSDLEAYRQVVTTMQAEGKFEPVNSKATVPSQQTNSAPAVVEAKPKQADDSKRKEQKRAVSPAKSAAPAASKNTGFDILSMSDDDFAKFKPDFS